MTIELTEEQRRALQNGETVRISDPRIGMPMVLLREDRLKALLEDEEDRKLQAAFLNASHQSAVAWMKENPY